MLKLNLDKHSMLEDLKGYPNQIIQTMDDLKNFKLKIKTDKISNIVFCGMGGSAIGGDLIRACFENEIKIPMIICRDYELPAFVNKNSLVIVCSFSGNTEETLSCFKSAINKKAKIISISSGGEFEKKSLKNKIAFFKLNFKSQCGQPRVNSGVMLTVVGEILNKLKLIKIKKATWKEIIKNLESLQSDCLCDCQEDNMALEIAKKMKDKIPVFHGGGFLAVVARRFKQDINETAKHLAFFEEIPESNHNALVGYEFPKAKKDLIMISLQSSLDNSRNELRYNILDKIWQKNDFESLTFMAESETKLEQVFYFVYLSMWVSFYLGILNGIDPTPVKIIEFLKKELAKK